MITSRPSRSWAVAAAFLLLAGVLVSASAATASTRAFSPIAKGDIIASLANGQVNEYTPAGSFVQTLIPSASTPTGSAFDSAGNLYVTEFGANDILKVDANTGAVSVFSNDTILGDGTTFNSPESIAFGPGFKYMYVSDANRDGTGGGIHVIDPATGKGVAFFALPSSAGSDGHAS
jgi:DNA-binding beta-propeller fold protein YncE